MATRPPPARRAKTSILEDRIDILSRNAVEPSPAQQVFRTVNAIQALVKDKMINNGDAVELSEYCFALCESIMAATRGVNMDDLDDSIKIALKDLERLTRETERIIRRATNSPRMTYDGGKVEDCKAEIQQSLGMLTAATAPLSDNYDAIPVPRKGFGSTISISTTESALWCLIGRTFTPPERSSLIESVLSSKRRNDTICNLHQENAQSLVDVIDEALLSGSDLPITVQKKCLKLLYKVCGRHALVPTSMKIPARYDRMGSALYRGGFADVWKGEHRGRAVAVKVLRTYSNSDLQKIVGRLCKETVMWRSIRHPNVLQPMGVTVTENQFAIISDWMENGNINEFVKANPSANRLKLLEDVARGLIYIHNQGMVHGDLKGANILIDQCGRARLVDFGLLTIISDPTNLLSSSSCTPGGTARWMSPELIAPEKFGLKTSRPTKSSDCYALGMVIYETITGNMPFFKHADFAVFTKVLEGEHPPRDVGFPDYMWRMLELCWAFQPSSRPSIEEVLLCLERVSETWEPHPATEGVNMDANLTLPRDFSGMSYESTLWATFRDSSVFHSHM